MKESIIYFFITFKYSGIYSYIGEYIIKKIIKKMEVELKYG